MRAPNGIFHVRRGWFYQVQRSKLRSERVIYLPFEQVNKRVLGYKIRDTGFISVAEVEKYQCVGIKDENGDMRTFSKSFIPHLLRTRPFQAVFFWIEIPNAAPRTTYRSPVLDEFTCSCLPNNTFTFGHLTYDWKKWQKTYMDLLFPDMFATERHYHRGLKLFVRSMPWIDSEFRRMKQNTGAPR